ncbi:50S ribosomal protein L32 [Acutalibacter sp. 1XD8-33]|uniref:50S ribosomal protein L32 n=1 Tax=Acutalibacter sp. 1XD8-33 TaxID=2320081 RepID=UPI000EA2130E|nr:50S ribosomal protein L32 [Acutalibacter sp. 1XD8-33]RKJ39017.1 50S ribosomal protein L32 [Acutalibacter sp. 1XD8-33]
MAVPKRKLSSARKNKRRSNVWKLQVPALTKCSQCGSYKAPHRVCPTCGYYNSRKVVEVDQ